MRRWRTPRCSSQTRSPLIVTRYPAAHPEPKVSMQLTHSTQAGMSSLGFRGGRTGRAVVVPDAEHRSNRRVWRPDLPSERRRQRRRRDPPTDPHRQRPAAAAARPAARGRAEAHRPRQLHRLGLDRPPAPAVPGGAGVAAAARHGGEPEVGDRLQLRSSQLDSVRWGGQRQPVRAVVDGQAGQQPTVLRLEGPQGKALP